MTFWQFMDKNLQDLLVGLFVIIAMFGFYKIVKRLT